jgi:Ca-activated chloride channel family protein
VANIGPGETIEVMIEFQQSVSCDQGKYSFTFPMVVGPRYIPLSMQDEENRGRPGIHPEMAADPGKILAPISSSQKADYPVFLRIDLLPGFPVKNITSPFLPVVIEPGDSGSYMVVPEGGTALRKDFVLTWEPLDEGKTYTAVFHEEVNGDLFSLVMIHPQAPGTIRASSYNREIVIIIDISGSMQGESIKQAKKALLSALDHLGKDDLFNIIAFNSRTRTLFQQNEAVNYRTVSSAKSFVNSLEADEGTEMYPALVQALSGNRDPDRLFQVIFITDGCVGNEAELFTYIKKNIQNGRLFTVGIGSAPNHYFMRKAALSGRGAFLAIGDAAEVQEKMDGLFQRLMYPVLTDISLSWSNSSAEILPDPVPDVYAGEPLIVCTRSYLDAGSLEISGSIGEQIWRKTLVFSGAVKNSGVGRLWARRKIEGLMDQLLEGTGEEEIRKKVIDVALEHHLVSQYTSLVAVEQVKSRPGEEQVNTEKLPLMLPEGWEMGQLQAHYPAAGTEMWLLLSLGVVLIIISVFYVVFCGHSVGLSPQPKTGKAGR